MSNMKVLRPHQFEAIIEAEAASLKLINLPTGTGKSLIQSRLISRDIIRRKEANERPGVYVIFTPRILLCNQLLLDAQLDLYKQNILNFRVLMVHSDKRIEKELNRLRDEYASRVSRYTRISCTVHCADIQQEYRRAVSTNEPLVVCCTYDSADRLRSSDIDIDMLLCDEAHYIVSQQGAGFGWIANKSFTIPRKYFFTATKKKTLGTTRGSGMGNVERFGTSFSRTPKQMIESGDIVRPRLHIVNLEDYRCNIEDDTAIDVNAMIDAFEAHDKEIGNKLGAKLLVCCKGTEHLSELLNSSRMIQFKQENPNVDVYDITSQYGPRINGTVVSRPIFLEKLGEVGRDDNRKALVLHLEILKEGIDVPGITGVMFFTNPDMIEFMQNLGRATRLHLADRAALHAEPAYIQPDELDKFIKPYAWIIVPTYVSDDLAVDLEEKVRSLREYGFDASQDVLVQCKKGLLKKEELENVLDIDDKVKNIPCSVEDIINEIEAKEDAELAIDKHYSCYEQWTNDRTKYASFNDFLVSCNFASRYEFENYVKLHVKKEVKQKRTGGEFVVSTIPYTPVALIREMFDKIDIIKNRCVDKEILVLYTIEMALILKAEGFNNITLCTTDFDFKMQIIAGNHGIKYSLVKDIKSMKFDVVVGNPPYQDNNPSNPRDRAIWPSFVRLACCTTTQGGCISLITPKTWVTSELYTEIFTNVDIQFINIDECAKHFPGVGSTFSYYIFINQPPSHKNSITIQTSTSTIAVNLLPKWGLGNPDSTAISILEKTSKHKPFKMITSSGYNTSKFKTGCKTVSMVQDSEHPYQILHKSPKTGNVYFYSSFLDTNLFNVPRVIIDIWKANYNKMFTSSTMLTCQQYRHYPVRTMEEADRLKFILQTPLYKFIANSLVSGGSHTNTSLGSFPELDLQKDWTIIDIYKHFELTATEIDYLETTDREK